MVVVVSSVVEFSLCCTSAFICKSASVDYPWNMFRISRSTIALGDGAVLAVGVDPALSSKTEVKQ